MLPFFARTLTRREMALGCAVLSLALLLSALPAALRWGQAQLDTGALLCADTLRFHIRADSDSPADQTVKLAVRDAVLAYADVHCTAQDKPAALRWALYYLFVFVLFAYGKFGTENFIYLQF